MRRSGAGFRTRTVDRIRGRLWDWGWRPQILLLLLVLASGLWLPRLGLDMSFRPLFMADGELVEKTADFEREFGQISGAWVAAILEGIDWRRPEGVAAVDDVIRAVDRIDGIAEVVSITRPLPGGAPDGGIRLLSADGRLTVVLARLIPPLEDLEARRPVIAEFRAAVTASLPAGADARFTGVSVVEDVYAREILVYLGLGVGLTVAAVATMLFLLWGSVPRVIVAMAGTSLATPLTLAAMAATGKTITLVSSMVPTMILVIGVADAIHMIGAFDRRRQRGQTPSVAARGMWRDMSRPCLLTTLTTAGGFLALFAAGLPAIREFGVIAAGGVVTAWFVNQLTVPFLLGRWPAVDAGRARVLPRLLDRWSRAAARLALRRPAAVIAATVAIGLVALAGVGQLRFDQRFNDELGADHPVARAQRLFEKHFGGLLGPELVIRRVDGALPHEADVEAVELFVTTLRRDRRVLAAWSGVGAWRHAVSSLESSPKSSLEPSPPTTLVARDGRRVAVIARVGDLGTKAARHFVRDLERLAGDTLGPTLELEVLGQWWLAQRGMVALIDDMVASFVWAFLLITPLMLIGLRQPGPVLASLVPNLLPLVLALGFMGWAGISVRIGTAMVLAIALGIAVDDSLHVLARYRQERRARGTQPSALSHTVRGTGPALIATTAVLIAGFLSMLTSGLVAIRDMGLVAAVALTGALLADLLLLPALLAIFGDIGKASSIRGARARLSAR